MSDPHNPRYSIIPGGAVTDPALEGRDLQVLCFLGRHTDRLGWCFLAQGTIAEELRCSRSTVQRSLARLCEAGWVAFKSASVGGRPHACHAYRVVMDRDDPGIGPSESEVDATVADDRCAPVHTSSAEVPAGAQGCAPVHRGAHPYVGTERPDSGGGCGGDARAREALVKPEAESLATEIAKVAGYPDVLSWPPGWCGAPLRVQAMLDQGWRPEVMLATARAVMAGKRDGPPQTIRYFERPFARAHAANEAPLPTVKPTTPESNHAGAPSWQSSRDNWRRAAAELGAAVDALDGPAGAGGEGRT